MTGPFSSRSLSRSGLSALLLLLLLTPSSAVSRLPDGNRTKPAYPRELGHTAHALPFTQTLGGASGALLKDRRGSSHVPVTIDGAVTPELIPDSIAYGHFIRATASSASAADSGRQQALLETVGLTLAERQAYVHALGNVGAQLASVRNSRKAAGPAASESVLRGLKQAEERAVAEAEERLRTTLPPAAMAKLDAHIDAHVKRRIKIYRAPMQ